MKYNFQCPIEDFKTTTVMAMHHHMLGKNRHEEHTEWILKQCKGRIPSDEALRDLIRKRCRISDKPNTQKRANL